MPNDSQWRAALAALALGTCASTPGAAPVVSVPAPAFDCARAATQVERMICGDLLLARADKRLAAIYADAASAPQGGARAQQRRWLASRNRCASVDCLVDAYAERTGELIAGAGATDPAGARAGATDLAACLRIADRASRRRLVPPPAMKTWAEEELQRFFGKDVVRLGRPEALWEVDLDGDGRPDRLAVMVQGSARIGSPIAWLARTGADVPGSTDASDGFDWAVVADGRRALVVGSIDPVLTSLWAVEPAGFRRLCGFEQVDPPASRLVEGAGESVCRPEHLKERRYAEYLTPHALPPQAPERYSPGAERVDMGHRGRPDSVVTSTRIHGGRGCEVERLRILDATRTRPVEDDPVQTALDSLPGACGSSADLFRFGGDTYVEVDLGGGDLADFSIRGGQARPVCRFEGTRVYDVQVPSREGER